MRAIASFPRRRASTAALALTLTSVPAWAGPPFSTAAPAPDPFLGQQLSLWSALPFAGLLLSIALLPLLAPRLWHRHFPRIAAGWAAVFMVPFLRAFGAPGGQELVRIFFSDYLPFILLLWALFAVSGGILIHGPLGGSPRRNTLVLLAGTGLASLIGTTGASMLLIRPLLRANARRRIKAHLVVFFIFLVGNIGGALTPLGDPPLFLGFLHGVPFFWTLRLLPHAGLMVALLLGLFYFWDSLACRREPAISHAELESPAASERLRVEGLLNLVWLGGIIGAVLLSGFWHPGVLQLGPVRIEAQDLARDVLLAILAILSRRLTPPEIRLRNSFTWEPMREVAILFAAIFVTILPALAILRAGADGALGFLLAGVRDPAHYFWSAGGLSSFLDNAPTYLAFFSSVLGKFSPSLPERESVRLLLDRHDEFLAAIAAGAVFMGANTYIGNAPNFLVKSIAEESGVRMPSFFGYIVRFTLPVLFPCFLLLAWVFF